MLSLISPLSSKALRGSKENCRHFSTISSIVAVFAVLPNYCVDPLLFLIRTSWKIQVVSTSSHKLFKYTWQQGTAGSRELTNFSVGRYLLPRINTYLKRLTLASTGHRTIKTQECPGVGFLLHSSRYLPT